VNGGVPRAGAPGHQSTVLMKTNTEHCFRKNSEPGEIEMSKGDKQRGNREAKKPKKVKEKVVATADFTKGKALTNLGEHKKK
jgi:hypothetical protein